jgi:hypothetical protein
VSRGAGCSPYSPLLLSSRTPKLFSQQCVPLTNHNVGIILPRCGDQTKVWSMGNQWNHFVILNFF